MIANITYKAELLKSHSEYPVTNTQWKFVDYSLNGYLESLNLKGYNQWWIRGELKGISHSYLRIRNKSAERALDRSGLLNCDPWYREFKCFPPDKLKLHSVYEYYCFSNSAIKIDVNVIVTTVNQQKVYCVDLIDDV